MSSIKEDVDAIVVAREAFLAAGWVYLDAIAGTTVCNDRTCIRCRIADLLFELTPKN